ncbi:MAG: hypothetical protein JW982_14440 [Spirochaetes bacterium]|nr:hypothetical protein [Spirochaetota bacterium]
MLITNLKQQNFVRKVESGQIIPDNSYILRINKNTAQLGSFRSYHDENTVILRNVIDLINNEYITDEGILRSDKSDELFLIESCYAKNIQTDKALNMIYNWALFAKYKSYQPGILNFVKTTFSPEFILWAKKEGYLSCIFIPIQQKFKIGRFSQNSRWEDINKIDFKTKLETLTENDYLTYIGYLPQHIIEDPMFYSTGKISHIETDLRLKKAPFLYNSNCGGNIKFLNEKRNARYFLVDAGASYKGKGVNATKEHACDVIAHLKKMYPEFYFLPASGRDALGVNCTF